MKGLKIFTHSVALVFDNFGAALRISGLLWLATNGLALATGLTMLYDRPTMEAAMRAVDVHWGPFILILIVSVIAVLWTAVGWHRFVLRSEAPGRILPNFHGDRILAYWGRTLQVMLILGVPAMIAGAVIAAVVIGVGPGPGGTSSAGTAVLGIGLRLLGTVVGSLVFYRLAPLLPAAALGEASGVADAWSKTAGITGTLLVLALASGVAKMLLELPQHWLTGTAGSFLWGVFTGWLDLMVGLSILTTIYGHYVEGRELR